jgi:ribosomal protein L22
MNKKKKINRIKVDTVRSVNNNIRSSVRKLNPILKAIVGKKVVMKRFRPRACFNEEIVNRILDDLVAATKPQRMDVVGEFSPRGGISLTASASYPDEW